MKKKEGNINKIICLTLLTETRVDVEKYGGNAEALISLTAMSGECQTDDEGTDSCGYSQPQTTAERRDVPIPDQSGVVG
jgi:hypothetical protein